MTQDTGCPHEHRTHLGEETRREVEPFFDGLEVSTGTVDLFDGADELITVHLLLLEYSQQQQLGNARHKWRVGLRHCDSLLA